jgi:hypothetical protein
VSEPVLDWTSAAVSDGELVVAIDGELPSGWKAVFETTAKLLDHGDWGTVKLKKQQVRVGALRPGDEDRLRHFLESVVQQANADCLEQDPDDDADADADGREQSESESESDADSAMTERFRSFAGG